MPNLPDTATVPQLAQEIGASQAEIDALPDEVKQLTKGQLLALWGAYDTQGAVQAYNANHGQLLPTPNAVGKDAPLHLSLQDVTALQNLFNTTRVQASIGGAAHPAAHADFSISCCCCTPCCTSATLLAG